MTLKWTRKVKQEFVRLRKKKKAFEVYDPRESHKLESRLLGEISITSDMQMTPPLWQKVKRS